MSRRVRVLLVWSASIAVAGLATACGTERIQVAKSSPLYAGATLFSQRCSGCHTLSYAGTHGSAPNVRTAQSASGPNFNVRCERPLTRVLYAIQNGGFSGAYMPQNIVVGQDAIAVAKFVATDAGRAAPKIIGITPCQSKSVGTVPAASSSPTATTAQTTSTSASSTSTSTTTTRTAGSSGAKGKKKTAHP
ncbi:MAG: c-type cytochrome [Solirubrobacteraceae bacterium]